MLESFEQKLQKVHKYRLTKSFKIFKTFLTKSFKKTYRRGKNNPFVLALRGDALGIFETLTDSGQQSMESNGTSRKAIW